MRDLTLVMPYYENGGMLREHQRVWQAYPADLKAALRVIMVDDASPTDPAATHVQPCGLASFQLCRSRVDVRWNWLFCRNLGVSLSTTKWVLLTDIDHVLPEETLRLIVQEDLDGRSVYRLSRQDAHHPFPWAPGSLTAYKPHPNTWLMTRKMFDRVGGYDERFSGFYGTDAEFRERVHGAARAVVMMSECVIRYPREIIPDASTTSYGRKEEQDYHNVSRIRNERAGIPGWRPLRLTFEWDRVLAIEAPSQEVA